MPVDSFLGRNSHASIYSEKKNGCYTFLHIRNARNVDTSVIYKMY